MLNYSCLRINATKAYALFLAVCFVTPLAADPNRLQEKYQAISTSLSDNSYGVPIYIESNSTKESQQGDIYGIIYHPFTIVKQSLLEPVNWCSIAPQHLNIKACTYNKFDSTCQIKLYSGRKYFEYPEDTYLIEYLFNAKKKLDNYFKAGLIAEDGPLGTSNYKISTEAIPLDDSSTFIHFSYSYNQGFWTRVAMSTYLNTIGRNKVGFTVIDKTEEGDPVYIDGVRGVIERNAMRYYYAIQSYLDTAKHQTDNRLLARLNRWFDLTEKHHRQLNEMDKKQYLEYKLQENIEQLRLQDAIKKENSRCVIPQASTKL